MCAQPIRFLRREQMSPAKNRFVIKLRWGLVEIDAFSLAHEMNNSFFRTQSGSGGHTLVPMIPSVKVHFFFVSVA